MAEPIDIPSLAALDTLLSTNKYLVLDFWAVWCPPCKAMSPMFTKLAQEHAVPGVLAFGKVDVDEAPDVASKFGVTAMPSFLFLVDGDAEKGVEVGEAVVGGGLVKVAEAAGNVVKAIRGADPRNLKAVVEVLGGLAKAEAEAGAGAGAGAEAEAEVSRDV